MIGELLSGISLALYTEFGADYEIYKESVEQGLSEPCFLISALSATNTPQPSKRYKRHTPFVIQYFPSTTTVQAECLSVLSRLWLCLEVVSCGSGLVRGSGMAGEVVDDVLQFTVSYHLFVTAVDDGEGDCMEELEMVGVW